ncbi:hypothetical protein G6F65_019817 [Rhizopus arrhizus]|nr:hypothetical protein G6F65_019817 [Rhizopus arrhizus]
MRDVLRHVEPAGGGITRAAHRLHQIGVGVHVGDERQVPLPHALRAQPGSQENRRRAATGILAAGAARVLRRRRSRKRYAAYLGGSARAANGGSAFRMSKMRLPTRPSCGRLRRSCSARTASRVLAPGMPSATPMS